MEKRGSGLRKMRELTEKLPNFLQGKEPQYQTEVTSFYTTFYNLNWGDSGRIPVEEVADIARCYSYTTETDSTVQYSEYAVVLAEKLINTSDSIAEEYIQSAAWSLYRCGVCNVYLSFLFHTHSSSTRKVNFLVDILLYASLLVYL